MKKNYKYRIIFNVILVSVVIKYSLVLFIKLYISLLLLPQMKSHVSNGFTRITNDFAK